MPLPQLFQRHILADHLNKTIYIQVMVDVNGNVEYEAFKKIQAGLFWDYIPERLAPTFRQGLASGYKILPICFNAMMDKEPAPGGVIKEFVTMQIHGIAQSEAERPIFNQYAQA